MQTSFSKNIFQKARDKQKPIILDGAMGSLLQQNNVPVDTTLWMSKANINYSNILKNIYHQYIEAGAGIITTNTFRSNPLAVKDSAFTSEELVKASLEIAIKAKGISDVIIAGSNPPAEDCYQKERTISLTELVQNHKTHIDLLLKYGSDFILNETQSHFDEIKIICEYCNKEKISFVMCLFTDDNLNLLSGESVNEVINYILDFNPLAIGFNCIMISTFWKIYEMMNLKFNWGFYLNCGDGSFRDKNITCGVTPRDYSTFILKTLDKSPSFIGSCCGSSPEHTKQIKEVFDG